MIGSLVAHGSDKARSTLPGKGKDRQEIGLVEIDVQFAIERRAGGFNIGNIEGCHPESPYRSSEPIMPIR